MEYVDNSRYFSVFNNIAFGNKRVDVIGCGAVGSKVAIELSKMGVQNIHLWDFDTIMEHNISNQYFGIEDIGKNKAECIAERMKKEALIVPTVHTEEVVDQELGQIVFLLVDTMSARKEIFDNCIRNKFNIKFLVETRMDSDNGRLYSFNPLKLNHVKKWEENMYTDEDASVSACGSTISVGATSSIISGMAVWQMIKWHSYQEGKDKEIENEILFALDPYMLHKEVWDD